MPRAFKQFFFAVLGCFSLMLLVPAQDQSGFISIDCGGVKNSSYTEETTGLNYILDADFIDTGETKLLLPEYGDKRQQPYRSLRSFPQGIRNCYRLNLTSNSKYLIRATFYYGNYDGQDILPEFELYIGPILWQSVTFQDASTLINYELIHVPLRDYIHVCLVNTGSGVPFISTIEIRLLPNSTFQMVLKEESSLALVSRFDTGQTAPFRGYRYPFDNLDRFWYSYNDWDDWAQLTASSTIDTSGGSYQIPSVVMNTAATPRKGNSFTNIWLPESDDEKALYYIYLHFAEVEKLQSNQYRQFNLTMNGESFALCTPAYGENEIFYNPRPLTRREINVSIIVAGNSTLPPILNAFEVYIVSKLSGLGTNEQDLNTITNIKSTYKIEKNWQGDPCAPQKYSWEGLNCTYPENNEPSRITSLDLSWSGLTGEITPWISNLAMILTLNLSNNNFIGSLPGFLSQLQNLRVLDLSNNNLTGSIPDFLSQLPNLNVLNLEKNMLAGSVPQGLMLKRNSGFLSLRLCNNPNLFGYVSCEEEKKKKHNFFILVGLPIIGASIIFLTVAAICAFKRKRKDDLTDAKVTFGSVESKKRTFTYSEILKITNNFETVLGKGGCGTVYHGYIDKTQEAAIKMLSPSSIQGSQQFHAEVDLLVRVHHRNLTNLVGYCNDKANMALVYEYMANGNLQEHLSVNSSNVLSMESRLQIATDAAQGLEYLHYGCKPPIIHRDVKSANILLNENFQAKVSDFGLSRDFPTDAVTHITTGVAGTPGYLDPEYYLSSRLNEKSDVYSFGIVLLEIITSRPVITGTQERINITQWVGFMLAKGDIYSLVDPRLERNFNVNSVWKAVEIAMACVATESNKRPTMSKVVVELKECLAIQLAQTDQSSYETELRNSIEMVSQTDSITMLRPSAR